MALGYRTEIGKRENEIRRTVTWERDALHVHV